MRNLNAYMNEKRIRRRLSGIGKKIKKKINKNK